MAEKLVGETPLEFFREQVTKALDCGLSYRQVQMMSGHRDPKNVMRYDHGRENLELNAGPVTFTWHSAIAHASLDRARPSRAGGLGPVLFDASTALEAPRRDAAQGGCFPGGPWECLSVAC